MLECLKGSQVVQASNSFRTLRYQRALVGTKNNYITFLVHLLNLLLMRFLVYFLFYFLIYSFIKVRVQFVIRSVGFPNPNHG